MDLEGDWYSISSLRRIMHSQPEFFYRAWEEICSFLIPYISNATSFDQALGMIERGGGLVSETEVKIKVQEPVAVPLEISFPGYKISELREVGKQLTKASGFSFEADFEGIGVVLRGRMQILIMHKR